MIKHDDLTPSPDAVPTAPEVYARLILLEEKFAALTHRFFELHSNVHKFTEEASDDFKNVQDRLIEMGSEVENLKAIVVEGNSLGDLWRQGFDRKLDGFDKKLDRLLLIKDDAA